MRIGELAAQAGVAASAVRFYEANGLLTPAQRGSNGYRDYPPSALQRLALIQLAQRLGFSLEEVRSVVAHGDGNWPHQLIEERLRQRQAELARLQSELAAQQEQIGQMLLTLEQHWAGGRCAPLEALTACNLSPKPVIPGMD